MRPNTHNNILYKNKILKDKHSRTGKKYRKPGKGGKLRYANLHHRNTIAGWRIDVAKDNADQ